METDYSDAMKLYTVYVKAMSNKDRFGEPFLEFEELPERVKEAWLEIANCKWDYQEDWRNKFLTGRQQKILSNAEQYSLDPFGDVAHELKLTLSKVSGLLDDHE